MLGPSLALPGMDQAWVTRHNCSDMTSESVAWCQADHGRIERAPSVGEQRRCGPCRPGCGQGIGGVVPGQNLACVILKGMPTRMQRNAMDLMPSFQYIPDWGCLFLWIGKAQAPMSLESWNACSKVFSSCLFWKQGFDTGSALLPLRFHSACFDCFAQNLS